MAILGLPSFRNNVKIFNNSFRTHYRKPSHINTLGTPLVSTFATTLSPKRHTSAIRHVVTSENISQDWPNGTPRARLRSLAGKILSRILSRMSQQYIASEYFNSGLMQKKPGGQFNCPVKLSYVSTNRVSR